MNFEEGSYIQDSAHDHTALGHTDLNNGIQSKADNKEMIKNLQEYSGLIHDSSM